jgi:hypothetical protein
MPAQTAEDRIRATNDDVYADALAIQFLIRLAVAALPQPTNAQEAAATVRAADMAVTALDRCNRIRRTVLRLDKENHDADVVLPNLPITEMTDLETAAMRADQARDDRELGITTPAGYGEEEDGMPIDDDDVVDVGRA